MIATSNEQLLADYRLRRCPPEAGLQIKIFPRRAAPIDLALAVVIGLDVALESPKEHVRILYRLIGPPPCPSAALSI